MNDSASDGAPIQRAPVYQTQRRVEFRDTDAAGIVHFSAFFPMMEAAEHEFLRSVGIPVMPHHESEERLTWPRVAASCDFHGPARFEDILQIDLHVDRIGRSSISYRFELTCEGRRIATGKITAVCCDLKAGGKLVKTNVPDDLRQRLSGPQND
ncbi:acyl-CoA thioesterase [Rhodopirellula europaea]|uniref:4-hydroxybenzoyl-CoA thioesterase n=1 Tax=Rhodopirellula europaea 6C TaxID=1263867 RepID=M2A394_9BACT|nr:thioesterase family protein [Rhodopirellula europaea]EMB13356.1 4-hydroxybenzoyl-CoA thioesterase [Rhodopirellula europaea 6C]